MNTIPSQMPRMSIIPSQMPHVGQNGSPKMMIICPYPDSTVSKVTRFEKIVMTFRLVSLQSIAAQFYDNYIIVIRQIIVQLIRIQYSLFNIPTKCILKISREQSRYLILLLIRGILELIMVYYQRTRIAERL